MARTGVVRRSKSKDIDHCVSPMSCLFYSLAFGSNDGSLGPMPGGAKSIRPNL